MKTSYLLLALAIVILFGTTAAYDIALQKAYLKSDYEKPYADYDRLNFKDFDAIEIVASNIIGTKITQGNKFEVKRHKWMDNIDIKQKGSTLIITFKGRSSDYYASSSGDVLIECPSLEQIKTDASFMLGKEQIKARKDGHSRFYGGYVDVKGFDQDSLSLIMNNFSTVYFRDNRFNFLDANVGAEDSSRSTIDIDKSNEILSANINLQQNSVMNLWNIHIKDFKYKLSDSAQVKLSGISLRLLSNKQ